MNDAAKPRRRFLARAAAAATALVLTGCDRLSRTQWFPRVLAVADKWNYNVAHAIAPRKAMAQEFAESDRSPQFRSNGTADPGTDEDRALASSGSWATSTPGTLRRLPSSTRSATWRAARAATGRIRATSGTRGFDEPVDRFRHLPLPSAME